MTLPVATRRAGPYNCNGSVVDFDFTFKVFTTADIRVVHTDADGVEEDLVLDGGGATGFTVVLNADQTADPGGTVTTVSTYASSHKITIIGDLSYEQPTELTNLGGFFPKVIENALDRAGIQIQQLAELSERGVVVPVSSGASGVLPAPSAGKLIGWNATEDGLVNYADLSAYAISAFAETLLDDTTDAAGRTTLDAARLTSSLTEDTAPSKTADFLHAYDTSGSAESKLRLVTALARAMPFGQGLLVNGKITPSVSSNALTLSIKTDADGDPSATDPVYALFRKASLTDGGFDLVPITTAATFTFSSGSTGGHASGKLCHLFAYLFNNGGTAVLGASNLPPDYPGVFADTRLASTTAEGGAGGADSATGIYTTSALTNKPWVCVAMLKSNQATAGTWATAIQQVDQAPFRIPQMYVSAYRASSDQSINNTTWTEVVYNAELYDTSAVFDTATGRCQPNVAGPIDVAATIAYASTGGASRVLIAIFKNSGPECFDFNYTPIAQQIGTSMSKQIMVNGTTDTVSVYTYQDSGAARGLDSSSAQMNTVTFRRGSGGQ